MKHTISFVLARRFHCSNNPNIKIFGLKFVKKIRDYRRKYERNFIALNNNQNCMN